MHGMKTALFNFCRNIDNKFPTNVQQSSKDDDAMNTLYYNEQPIFDSEARREMM
jgi:hypothetical protein